MMSLNVKHLFVTIQLSQEKGNYNQHGMARQVCYVANTKLSKCFVIISLLRIFYFRNDVVFESFNIILLIFVQYLVLTVC
jgi:hypothetical protein